MAENSTTNMSPDTSFVKNRTYHDDYIDNDLTNNDIFFLNANIVSLMKLAAVDSGGDDRFYFDDTADDIVN